MDVKLDLIKGNPKGKQVEVAPGTLSVGRAEDSDLIIASTRVSRHHCDIVNEGDTLLIRDKGSGNGTFVNRKRIQEQALRPGDEVRIGPLTFIVEIDGVRKPPAQAAPAPKPEPATRKRAAAAEPKIPAPGPARTTDDIASNLERLSGGKKPEAKAEKPPTAGPDDGRLQISDEDLLDSDA
ncbi:MAG: FHA domain-containing protein [Phycisphaerae bacterium]